MSFYNIAVKAALAGSVGIGLFLLDVLGFDPSLLKTDVEIMALKGGGLWLPSLILLPGVLLLWTYPLNANQPALPYCTPIGK